jgi:hypothetical protein
VTAHQKARALFVVCAVVLATVGGSVAFSGAVAAANTSTSWDATVNGTAQTATYNGSGTSADPYEIDSLVDLQAIGKNDTTLGYHYELVADIDAGETNNWNGGKGFAPLGGNGDIFSSFAGEFDGNNHSIDKLHIDRPSTPYIGLFGLASSSANVSNVRLTKVDVTGNKTSGSLAGVNNGNISNVYVSGEVIVNGGRAGGVVGELFDGRISDAYSATTVTAKGEYVGGLVGWGKKVHINRSAATGTVTAQSSTAVGGLVGLMNTGSAVNDSYSSANVTGNESVGGLVGSGQAGAAVGTSYASGRVTGNSTVGGLLGVNDSDTAGSYWLC